MDGLDGEMAAGTDGEAVEGLEARIEELRSGRPSPELVALLNRLARRVMRGDPGSAESLAGEALKLSDRLKLPRDRAESLQVLGVVDWRASRYTEALKHFRDSLEAFEALGDDIGIASVYDQMGSIYQEQGFTDIALEHYLQSLRLAESSGDEMGVAACYCSLGDLYGEKTDYSLAISSYTRAMAILEEFGRTAGVADCLFRLAGIYMAIESPGKALDFCQRSARLREEAGDTAGLAESLRYLGTVYEAMKEPENARDSYRKSYELFLSLDRKGDAADACWRLGGVLIGTGFLEEARVCLEEGLAMARSHALREAEARTLQKLSLLHEASGDLEKALECIRGFSRLREKIISSSSEEQFRRLQVLFETEIKEEESEIYRLRNVELEDLVRQHTAELQKANRDLRAEIGERMRAEQARERAEATLKSFLDNVEDMVYYQSSGGTINHLNTACLVVTGYSREEYDDDPELWRKIVHPEDYASRMERLESRQDGALVANQEYRLLKKSGEWCWIHSHMVAIQDSRGRITGYSCIDRDFTSRKTAEQELQQSFDSLERSFQGTIFTMARIVETRDPYTSGHQLRVAELARAIATRMKLPEETVQTVFLAAVVHDIGKICIPQELLSKPGKLNEIEMDLIRTHPKVSFEILSGIDFPWPIADIVLQHHEYYDGTGYPEGLRGEDIALEARVLCTADVVEAMSSHRPYRPRLGTNAALMELMEHRGSRYDPAVVDACRDLFVRDEYTLPEYSDLIL